jgi:hypothetical protein
MIAAKNALHQLGASLTLNQLPTHRFGRFLSVIARSRRCGGVEREDADIASFVEVRRRGIEPARQACPGYGRCESDHSGSAVGCPARSLLHRAQYLIVYQIADGTGEGAEAV